LIRDVYGLQEMKIVPDGTVWIVLDNVIWFYNGDTWQVPISENELPFLHIVGGLAIDKTGYLYTWGTIGKTDKNKTISYGGLAYYNGRQW